MYSPTIYSRYYQGKDRSWKYEMKGQKEIRDFDVITVKQRNRVVKKRERSVVLYNPEEGKEKVGN